MSEQFQGENLDAVTRRMKEGDDNDADFQGESLDAVTDRMKSAGLPDDDEGLADERNDMSDQREAGSDTSAANQGAQDEAEDALRARRESFDE
jgi:hypothetical protein